ncbi:protoporphyrinogen oxidase [Streptomyces spongiicola]|uniref:Coproporphyrinogen III oxidase n=1 Tax=Streptomyces spongiicola TaxID=1690221 RepID=A0A2S1Z7F9_9ACTN|nr:protoporphyrinogen oxidase [Streptomyces spongiicola]AWK11818.1 protoporphyrinogen oxidase [Streptomyces spongiicola]GBP98855.1 protoporphyrinogen oxidase [Streptomyces spongiicola]
MLPTSEDPRARAGRVVVIGGGIAGLAAAHRLATSGVRVTLLEAGGRLGGKLRTGEIAGAPVDLGAESVLARRPEAVALARAVGLGDRLRPPATTTASVWTRDALHPMPRGHVMGVPGTPEALSGLLSAEGVARIGRERELPPAELAEDVAVGTFVAERLGHEVVDRLVEPLLGGVYAGDAYRISMRAAVPALFDAARAAGGNLLDGVREVQRRTAERHETGPVFMGLDGGVGTLPAAVADAVRAAGGEILTETPVLRLTRGADGWRIRTDAAELIADGVVLAVPAWSASVLLADAAPAASAELSRVEYASMALVTLAFRAADTAVLPAGSGFLVPPVDGRTIKASTFSAQKWGWVADRAPGLFLLRTSVGRYGEEKQLDREDDDLVAASLGDLAEATGLTARPVASRVTRWTDGLPQYPVGHLGRVARVRDAVAALPGLRVCGAAYDGVGIPACVGSGQRAADEVIATAPLVRGAVREGRE